MDPELPACMCDATAEASIAAMEKLYSDYHGAADGRIHIWFSLSSPMSSSPQLVEGVALAAKKRGTGIHIHLGEHPAEVQTCLARWGLRPPSFLDKYGALGSNVIAAHCIQITDFDIRLMAERGIHVIHCPTANLPTQGIPKLLAERAAGLNIALGNDGATTARQDMFAQAQLLKYVTQAVYGTPVFEPIVLPLAKPAIVVTCVMVLITVWNEYLFATTFLLDSTSYSLAGGLYQLQSNDYSRSWPLFSAAAVLVSLPILAVFFKIQKYMVSGLTAGGVKG